MLIYFLREIAAPLSVTLNRTGYNLVWDQSIIKEGMCRVRVLDNVTESNEGGQELSPIYSQLVMRLINTERLSASQTQSVVLIVSMAQGNVKRPRSMGLTRVVYQEPALDEMG